MFAARAPLGLCWGAYSTPPNLLSDFFGVGAERSGEMEKERKERGGRGEEREREVDGLV